jgi:hypothetical protein
MHKNTYLTAEASYEDHLVLSALKELPTIRNKEKREDQVFTKVLSGLTVAERADVFLKCIQLGHVG